MTVCLYKFEYTVAHLWQSLLVVWQALGAFSASSYLVLFISAIISPCPSLILVWGGERRMPINIVALEPRGQVQLATNYSLTYIIVFKRRSRRLLGQSPSFRLTHIHPSQNTDQMYSLYFWSFFGRVYALLSDALCLSLNLRPTSLSFTTNPHEYIQLLMYGARFIQFSPQ